jgi:hypothetical protein
MATKYTKWPQRIPNGRQMAIKYNNIIYPNWDFWFENMPSGNPGPNDIEKNKYLKSQRLK